MTFWESGLQVTAQLKQYEDLGPEFKALTVQYHQLLEELRHAEYSLQEFQQAARSSVESPWACATQGLTIYHSRNLWWVSSWPDSPLLLLCRYCFQDFYSYMIVQGLLITMFPVLTLCASIALKFATSALRESWKGQTCHVSLFQQSVMFRSNIVIQSLNGLPDSFQEKSETLKKTLWWRKAVPWALKCLMTMSKHSYLGWKHVS